MQAETDQVRAEHRAVRGMFNMLLWVSPDWLTILLSLI